MCRVLFSRDYFRFETAGLGYLTQTLTAAELEGLGRPAALTCIRPRASAPLARPLSLPRRPVRRAMSAAGTTTAAEQSSEFAPSGCIARS
jgi:hypothetical protein